MIVYRIENIKDGLYFNRGYVWPTFNKIGSFYSTEKLANTRIKQINKQSHGEPLELKVVKWELTKLADI